MGLKNYQFAAPGGTTKRFDIGFQDLGRIRYNGLLHVGDLFQTCRDWFASHKYIFVEKSVKHKYGSGGLEKEYEWRPHKRINEYLKYEVRMVFKIKNIADVEVIRDGKKEKLQQAWVLIQIVGRLHYDTYGRGKNLGWIGQNIQALYLRVMKPEIMKVWVNDFENHLRDLKKHITNYLEYESTIQL